MKKILITGSSGFVGKHLSRKLDQLNIKPFELDIAKGYDLTSLEFKNEEKFDLIIHLASRSYVPHSFQEPKNFYYTNFFSTLNILELARAKNSDVIFFSSYLYGTPLYLPIDEEHPLFPHNPYAQSKLICEKLCEGYYRDFGVKTIILRPFNLYGSGQNMNFLIPAMISQMHSGFMTLDDPRPRRDYLFIDDLISLLIKMIDKEFNGLQVYNIGSGVSYSVYEVATKLSSLFRKDIKISFRDVYRKNEVLETVANIDKVKRDFNWYPRVEINEGLMKVLNTEPEA